MHLDTHFQNDWGVSRKPGATSLVGTRLYRSYECSPVGLSTKLHSDSQVTNGYREEIPGIHNSLIILLKYLSEFEPYGDT